MVDGCLTLPRLLYHSPYQDPLILSGAGKHRCSAIDLLKSLKTYLNPCARSADPIWQ